MEDLGKLMRKVIEIDEDKCDGCELCVKACHEGAIAMVDGKAKLVSDTYCDGLGDCIGECPLGAITVIEREALPFDEEAVKARLEAMGRTLNEPAREVKDDDEVRESELTQWPVQLHLVHPGSPWLKGARLLLAADCVLAAHPDFHRGMLRGRKLLLACPKLDDTRPYVQKLAMMIRGQALTSLEVAIMEVPCCRGLASLVQRAVQMSGVSLEPEYLEVTTKGEVRPYQPRQGGPVGGGVKLDL